ncbi:hypothetical protein [Bacillus velezensis]|uniref:hypothetical protein n=1 Tax=Bacillus velezensis TaxID=492670 RepID=UPI001F236BE4|nr:hypothetical protein [Bacillus velezensis]MCE4941140.1 hypothetical protein [Bacillus velezensis]MDH3074724.1 hypothetical protein [Bacillus velezensis]MDH3106356.1 hypothetical protein [Bacillus velezensis]MDH3136368.1 hypothetical protein [Bacillus velezensis]
MIFYSSNSVGFTSQVLLSGWGKHVHLDKKFCACHEYDTDCIACRRLYLPANRLLPCFSSERFSPAQGLISKRLAARK